MPFRESGTASQVRATTRRGQNSNQTFEEWNRETGGRKLPERVAPKKAARKRSQSCEAPTLPISAATVTLPNSAGAAIFSAETAGVRRCNLWKLVGASGWNHRPFGPEPETQRNHAETLSLSSGCRDRSFATRLGICPFILANPFGTALDRWHGALRGRSASDAVKVGRRGHRGRAHLQPIEALAPPR